MKRKYGLWGLLLLLSGIFIGCSRNPDTVPTIVAPDAVIETVPEQTQIPSYQDPDGYVYESRDELVYALGDVNIRRAATGQSEILDVLKQGKSIRRTAWNDSWSKVEYGDVTGYIASAYLTTEKPQEKTEASAGTEIDTAAESREERD